MTAAVQWRASLCEGSVNSQSGAAKFTRPDARDESILHVRGGKKKEKKSVERVWSDVQARRHTLMQQEEGREVLLNETKCLITGCVIAPDYCVLQGRLMATRARERALKNVSSRQVELRSDWTWERELFLK